MRTFFIMLFVLTALVCSSRLVVNITDRNKIENLAYNAEFLEDPKGALSINDLLQPTIDNKLTRVGKQIVGFGLTPSFFWIKSIIHNHTNEGIYLKIGSNPVTDIQVYETRNQRVQKQYHSGNWQPFKNREVQNVDYMFPLNIMPDSTAAVYIRVMHWRGTQFPLQAGTLKSFYTVDVQRSFFDGIYYGLMLLMILYNLFIYFSLKDASYLYYVAYIFLIAFFSASMDGYAFRYLWPSLPVINLYEDVFAALVGMAAILFATHFLNTKENTPLFHRIFYGLLIIYIVIIAIIVSKNFLLGTIAVEIASLGLVVLIFIAAFSIMRKGYRPAKFFLIAWSLLLFSAIVFILKDYNLLPYNNITINALQIGSAFEVLLLSIALADRINSYREERTKAQDELIKSLQERTTMQQQMLQLEAKALRSQMDPHFIFNCMNSIKSLIQQKEEDKAINYLTTFSKLLRTILQNADKREITLHDEIETCKLYTQLESLRFGNKFSYSFEIGNDIDLKSIQVPALILQPFIENAIWHGIIPKENGGAINVRVKKADGSIHCIIDDDGIGRDLSLQNKLKQPSNSHQSKGVKLTQSRLDLDNALNKRNAKVETIDKKNSAGEALGTTIVLTFKEY